MYNTSITFAYGSGKARCFMCKNLIGKNQPCLKIESGNERARRSGVIFHPGFFIHAIVYECPATIVAFHLQV